MSRDLPTDLSNEVVQPDLRPFLAVRIELPDPVYVWSGRGILEFPDADGNNRTWLGAGDVGTIDTVGEATDGSAQGMRVSLLNVPSEFRDDIADQATRGVLFEVDLGALDMTYQNIVGTTLLWKGRLDKYDITDSGSSITVELTGESRAIDQRRPAIKRFTDEYQQRQHPGDLFFQYVPQMTEVSILWAQGEQNSVTTSSSGSGMTGAVAERMTNYL